MTPQSLVDAKEIGKPTQNKLGGIFDCGIDSSNRRSHPCKCALSATRLPAKIAEIRLPGLSAPGMMILPTAPSGGQFAARLRSWLSGCFAAQSTMARRSEKLTISIFVPTGTVSKTRTTSRDRMRMQP